VTALCAVCGTSFERTNPRRFLCSPACSQAGLRQRRKAAAPPAPARVCSICGMPFLAVSDRWKTCGSSECVSEQRRLATVAHHKQPHVRAKENAARAAHPLRRERRRSALMRRYSITSETYVLMLANQGGRCAICGSFGDGRPLHVDHDHNCCPRRGGYKVSCGRCIRGLLCGDCNAAIGLLRDNPGRMREAARYIELWLREQGSPEEAPLAA
jgi:hypothetical protein